MTEADSVSYWTSSVSDVGSDDVFVRGYPLCDLIGRLPFPAMVALVIRGKMPTPAEARMMDVVLCSVLDYGLKKSGTAAARFVASVNPQMLPALATAVLAAGEHALSPEGAGKFILDGYSSWKAGGRPMDVGAAELVAKLRREKRRVPGFGHPTFRGVDPRAQRLKEAAIEERLWGPICDWYEHVHAACKRALKTPDLVLNDVGMMAAILAQMDYSPQEMAGLAMLSTMPGAIAHISEEIAADVRGRIIPDCISSYRRERRDLTADMSDAGW